MCFSVEKPSDARYIEQLLLPLFLLVILPHIFSFPPKLRIETPLRPKVEEALMMPRRILRRIVVQ